MGVGERQRSVRVEVPVLVVGGGGGSGLGSASPMPCGWPRPARIQIDRPDLIASRYDGLPAEGLEYSFETQAGIPVDGTNPLLRDLSPFTLRIAPPKALQDFFGSDVNINLIGNANQQAAEKNRIANQFRQAIGSKSVVSEADAEGRLLTLKSIVTTGGAAASGTERAVMTDVLTAADTVYQLEQILQAPPLTLLVNLVRFSIARMSRRSFEPFGRDETSRSAACL